MTEELLKKDTPVKITLSDGKEYELPVISLNTLTEIEAACGCSIDGLMEQFTSSMATTLRNLLCALLKENYPDMTPEKVGKLVTVDRLKQITDEVMGVITSIS